jgi:LPPG:FO 2-phospho-L-lactate transferase
MRIVALSGGVGGARFLDGLAALTPFTAIVNTGDDFRHYGLHIAPDLDTVMYTLSGLAHEERGWGLYEESFANLEMMRRLGGDDWFALGDRDLAVHLRRTQALAAGCSLSEITQTLTRALGITTPILPMSDDPAPTMIECDEGTLHFQEWFVRRRAQPRVSRVYTAGQPRANPLVLRALDEADLILIGPSNPYVSIDPILSLPGVRSLISRKRVVAVSPIVGGRAVKGPLAEMIPALAGAPASAAAIARHYPFLGGIVVEHGDDAPLAALRTSIVMRDRGDRRRLAAEVLAFAESL